MMNHCYCGLSINALFCWSYSRNENIWWDLGNLFCMFHIYNRICAAEARQNFFLGIWIYKRIQYLSHLIRQNYRKKHLQINYKLEKRKCHIFVWIVFFQISKRKNSPDYDINYIIYVDPPLNLLSFISNKSITSNLRSGMTNLTFFIWHTMIGIKIEVHLYKE